jgi:hypothetical protein
MIRGSCLCGAVAYEAEGPLVAMARCHCEQCRKASGAEFATNGSVSAEAFRILRGEEALGEYQWSPGKRRIFCKNCGSPLFKKDDASPHQVRLRLGSVDTPLDQKPLFHVFVSEKPAWSEITDALPEYSTRPGA